MGFYKNESLKQNKDRDDKFTPKERKDPKKYKKDKKEGRRFSRDEIEDILEEDAEEFCSFT